MAAEEQRPSGWLPQSSPPGGGTNFHLAQQPDGRWVVDAIYIYGPEITPSTVQKTQLGKLGRALNLGVEWQLAIRRSVPKVGEHRIHLDQEHDGEFSLKELQDLAREAPAQLELQVHSADRPRLTRPTPDIEPDEFYKQVAAAYREYALQSRSPAKQIAAEAGSDVPVTTAHRWIREARRRGFLPPIRKGAVG
jgi:hypothetical protein